VCVGRLLSIAEETVTEFISKATGTAIDWIQLPGMKPGPHAIGIVAISHGCLGVAARACSLVGLEPSKVIYEFFYLSLLETHAPKLLIRKWG
jgi:hypothetical protein